MIESGFYVNGKRFASKVDYEAALDDKKLIDDICSRYNLKNAESVMELYRDLSASKFKFKSSLGTDFDDEIYELTRQIKAGTFQPEFDEDEEPVKRSGLFREKKEKKEKTVKKAPVKKEVSKPVRQKAKKNSDDMDYMSPAMRE